LGLNDLILVGHSLGGIIATIYASHHPDQINRLVIVDIGPQITATGFERMKAVRQGEPKSFASEDEVKAYLRRIEPRQSTEFIQHFIHYALKKDQENRLAFKYDKALYNLILRSPTWLWDDLEQVICPTLVMNGQDSDLLDLKVAQKMVEKLPFGNLAVIEKAGHNLLGDNPEVFCSSMREFLLTSHNVN
jgi:pimeloyl-ACP methyl ester carboxylesterase